LHPKVGGKVASVYLDLGVTPPGWAACRSLVVVKQLEEEG